MAHTFANLLFHVIFGTKERVHSISDEWRGDLHAYIGGIINELHGIPIIVNGTVDHVHALIKLPPTAALADVLRVVKTNSSKWRHERGSKKFAWQSGYAAFTVSESSADSVRSYIANQQEHHRARSFAEEYIEFLEKNHIALRSALRLRMTVFLRRSAAGGMRLAPTHGLRRGLYSCAAPRLMRGVHGNAL